MKRTAGVVLFLCILALLTGLGIWQVKRLAWKTDIIGTITAEYAKDPLTNTFDIARLDELGQRKQPLAFGSITGEMDFNKDIAVGPKTLDGKIGYHIITPMYLSGGGTVLINRGWREKKDTKIAGCACRLPRGTVSVSGILRKPDTNNFTTPNSPANDQWSHTDIPQISDHLSLNAVAAVVMYAERTSKDMTDTVMQTDRWLPRNEHKQYAAFWFTMAAVWAGMGMFFAMKKRKRI